MVWFVAVAFGAFTLGFLLAALLGGARSEPTWEADLASDPADGHRAAVAPPATAPRTAGGERSRIGAHRSPGGLAHG